MPTESITTSLTVARPTESGRAMFERLRIVLPGPKTTANMATILESDSVLRGIANAMERAVASGTSKDGRVDWLTAAAHIMATMKANQR